MIDDPEAPDVGVLDLGTGRTLWRVWASRAQGVTLVLDPEGPAPEERPLAPQGRGYFAVETATPEVGRRYGYRLDGGAVLPDPCSAWQPDGVGRPSAVDFPARFAWADRDWRGVARADLVFYELHVGTFTPEGTFDAVIPRLAALKELGVTAVELMPVAQFPGVRSWGYDGVFPFAPQHSYGGPEALRRLVDACHRQGLAAFLDVIFNHFGPEGNVLTVFGDYLNDKTRTDWGPALNFDARGCDAVRAFAVQNVRTWIRDYHFDGLRFDAADQVFDRGPRHILADLVTAAHAEGKKQNRAVHLFAETDLNDAPRFLHEIDRGGYGFDGHWNDDFHHAAHVTLTGEAAGYYEDFAPGPPALQKSLDEVFVNNGSYSKFRGRRHGTTAREFPGDRFVGFTQNHDQVGNRAKSDRNAASLPPSAVRLAAGLLLLAPRLPLLFMGEEYGETNPFPFFCDYASEELRKAVRDGRKAEFGYFGWDEVPDPMDPGTRDRAVLSWDWTDPGRHRLRTLYATLLKFRRELAPLRDYSTPRTRLHGGQVLEVQRGPKDGPPGSRLVVLLNLDGSAQPVPAGLLGREWAFRSEAEGTSSPDRLEPHEFGFLRD